MTSHDTPNPTPQTPTEIEADLVRQREELAETVQALQNKLDVKSQVQYKAAEFKDRATKDIIPQARDRQLVSQANVVGVGVLEAQRTSASVMVFMNRTVTDKSRQPIYDGSRLRVDYQKIDGKWLINYITPI